MNRFDNQEKWLFSLMMTVGALMLLAMVGKFF